MNKYAILLFIDYGINGSRFLQEGIEVIIENIIYNVNTCHNHECF
jgi:hypothetical protein